MRTRIIALSVLLTVAATGPSMALPIAWQSFAAHVPHDLPHHACCPIAPRLPIAPTPAPRTDHRCCFLRGSVSSLPVNIASENKPALTRLPRAGGEIAPSLALRRFVLTTELAVSPPHSLATNVVLRN